jgi:D-xylose transport system permease protein
MTPPTIAASPSRDASVEEPDGLQRVVRESGKIARENGGYSPIPGLIALVAIYVVFAVLYSSMTGAYTIYTILLQLGSYGFVALGVTLVLIIGEIDLSVGSVAGLGSALVGVLVAKQGVAAPLAIVIGIAAGGAIGVLQGVIITQLQVPSFVITLGGLLAWQGVQLAILSNTTLIVPNPTLDAFGSEALSEIASWVIGALIVAVCAVQRLAVLLRRDPRPSQAVVLRRVGETVAIAVVVFGGLVVLGRGQGVPLATWIFLALVAITGFVLQRTRAGRAVYAVGGNREGARRAGYRPDFVRVTVFGLSGAFAALGGIYILSRGGTADTLTGTGDLVLVSIAAAVIGGCSLFGGRGSPWAAPIGALVITTLVQGLNIANSGANVQLILEGSILVIAVAVDAIMRRRLTARGSVSG